MIMAPSLATEPVYTDSYSEAVHAAIVAAALDSRPFCPWLKRHA